MMTKKCQICNRIAQVGMYQIFTLKGKQKKLNDEDRNYIDACLRCSQNMNYDRLVKIISSDSKWLMWCKDIARMTDNQEFLVALEKFESGTYRV